MRGHDHEERSSHGFQSSHEINRKRAVDFPALPGFLPTSAESVKLALSFPLHGMPHDRVFGVYKEGYYNLISIYLWDIYQLNLLIDSCTEYLDVAPISLDNFSSGLVTFIQVAETFSSLLCFFINNEDQRIRDAILERYQVSHNRLEANFRHYEIQAQEIVRLYMVALDAEIQTGLIRQSNRYKIGYKRLLEMYSEDIAAINRVLGNHGVPFITDKNLLNIGKISKLIITARLLRLLGGYNLVEREYSPTVLSPVLNLRSPTSRVREHAGTHESCNYNANRRPSLSPSKRVAPQKRSVTSNLQSGRHLEMDPLRCTSSVKKSKQTIDIRTQLYELMAAVDRNQVLKDVQPRAKGPHLWNHTPSSGQSNNEHSIAESQGIDIGLQTTTLFELESRPDLEHVGIDAATEAERTPVVDCAVLTDVCTNRMVHVTVNTLTETFSEMGTQTIAIEDVLMVTEKIGTEPMQTVTAQSIEKFLTERVTTMDADSCVVIQVSLLDALLKQTLTGDPEYLNDPPKQMIKSVINTTVDCEPECMPVAQEKTSDSAVPQGKASKDLSDIAIANSQTTSNGFFTNPNFDTGLAKLSVIHETSLELSEGEGFLQPVYDSCEQSSLAGSADCFVGTALLRQPQFLPELFLPLLSTANTQPAEEVDTDNTYKTLYHELLEKYTAMEEEFINHALEAEKLQARVSTLTEESESLKIALQKLKDGYFMDNSINNGMIVQGSVSEQEDTAKTRYIDHRQEPKQAETQEEMVVLLEREWLLNEIRSHENQCQALWKAAQQEGISLNDGLSELESDSALLNSQKSTIVSSVIRTDEPINPSGQDILMESVIALKPQHQSELDTMNTQKYIEVVQENSLLLRRLRMLERQEKTLLDKLNLALSEKQTQAELNKNMQNMLSSIQLTVHAQLNDVEEFQDLISNIEESAFSLRPELKKLHSCMISNIVVSPCASSSESFIDRLDD